MLSIRGVYENGEVKLLEPIPMNKQPLNLIITILEENAPNQRSFGDLPGVVSIPKDSSANHDQHMSQSQQLTRQLLKGKPHASLETFISERKRDSGQE